MNFLRFTKRDALCCALLVLGTVAAIWRFWQPGVASNADMLMGIYRVFELKEAWQSGILYPRIGPDLNFGYGAPLFQFYPPLFSYGALVFYWAGLGFIHSTKAMFALSLLVAAFGMYLYARWLFQARLAALLSATIYLFAPYMLTVIYERGAAAEGLALALLPWVFWLCHRLLYQNEFKAVAVASCAVALLMLAHNITTLFAIAAVVVYTGLLAIAAGRLKQLPLVWGAIAGGLGLSAFYWIPALFEIDYTAAEEFMLGDGLTVFEHLVGWLELFQTVWRFDYWGVTRFRFSLWYGILGGIALLLLPFQEKRLRYFLVVLGGFWLVILLLQIESMEWLWGTVPLIQFVQFPWRLFGLASFCVAILVGSILQLPLLAGWFRVVLLLVLLTVVISQSLYNLHPFLSDDWYAIDEEQINKHDLFERGRYGYPLFADYTPVDLKLSNVDLSLPEMTSGNPPPVQTSAPTIQISEENPTRTKMQVRADAPFTLRAHKVFFPGWQFYVDGRKIATEASGLSGVVTAELPAGEYGLTLRFAQTPLRWVADGISLLTVLGLLVGLSGFRRRRTIVVAGLFVIVLSSVWFARQWFSAQVAHHPSTTQVNFQDELRMLGYHLPRTTYALNETIVFHLYWLVQNPPNVNYKIFVHLAELDDSGTVLQGDSEPMLGYSPMTRWEAGEIIADEYHVDIGDSLPPGRYRLLIGVYHPETVQNLLVYHAPPTVLPGDRVILTEITVADE